ncbi:hypothetical protein [Pectobacterium carotovorum]|uniref:hypothetical protein n=1 Tax=Pectobacterium carotovorum TaxID=554 RepID=UPI003019A311
MSDTYQAVYDAVRSRISNGDIGSSVDSAMRDSNISFYFEQMMNGFNEQFSEYGRPCVVFSPQLSLDGNAWLAIFGDLPTGVVGVGNSPAEAMYDFDKQWLKKQEQPTAA